MIPTVSTRLKDMSGVKCCFLILSIVTDFAGKPME